MKSYLSNSLLVINLLQVLMIFYKIGAILNNKGYFASLGGKDVVEVQILPAFEPVPVLAPVLRYSLVGFSLSVVLMVTIPIGIVITKRIKSKSNPSNSSSSSRDHPILDLSHEERLDFIKKKEFFNGQKWNCSEEIKEIEQEKNVNGRMLTEEEWIQSW